MSWDWSVFWSTFTLLFLAELGDKTQFAAMASASQTKSVLSVLVAVVLALSVAGVLGVVAGRLLANLLNPQWMKVLSGSLFLVMGIWILFKS